MVRRCGPRWRTYADWCFLLVRTDPTAPKHRGISYLLVNMKTPGITVRPLRQITGDSDFNEVFFEDVRVPRENLVGRLNEGWRVAMNTLSNERGTMAFALAARFENIFNEVADLCRQAWAAQPERNPMARQQVAQFYIDLQALSSDSTAVSPKSCGVARPDPKDRYPSFSGRSLTNGWRSLRCSCWVRPANWWRTLPTRSNPAVGNSAFCARAV